MSNASRIATSATRNALHKVVARVNSRLFAFALPRAETRGARWRLWIHNAIDWTGNVCKLLNIEWLCYRLWQQEKRSREKENSTVQINVMRSEV